MAAERAGRDGVETSAGRHFDPRVVDAFGRVFPNLPAALA